jgi:hypothetical protein
MASSDSGGETPVCLSRPAWRALYMWASWRVHPFADGNHRASFVALSAALWSLGLPAVEFAQDTHMTDHDDAIAPALFSPDGDIEPFARLLATRIEHARRPVT